MKTITLFAIAAVVVFAQNQNLNPNKNASDKTAGKKTAAQKTAQKTAGQKTVAQPAPRENSPRVAQPVRPNLHYRSVAPTVPPLTPEQKAAAALPTVPQGAQPVGPNLYRYTDAQGKTWMYRQTPFGVSKWEDQPGDEQNVEAAPKPLPATATDLGDSVQFERDTPFGHQKWIVKKSDLTPDEKATLDAQKAKSPDPKNDAAKNDAEKNLEKQ